jgi:MFS transporter, MHS family, proline/betaine transporter
MVGILLSSMAVWTVRSVVSDNELAAWGWRLPFLVGLVVMIFGVFIRTRIPETLQPNGDPGRVTNRAFRALRNHWHELIQVIGMVTGANVVLYLLFVFVLHVAAEAGASHVEEMNTIGLAVTIPATVLGGWLSDRFGRKRVSFITNLAMMVLAVPAFSLSVWFAPWPGGPSPGPTAAFMVAQLLMAVPMGIVFGVQGVMISEMLPKEVRCTVFSVAYSLAMALFAGTAPMVAEWMLKREDWHLGPALYMVAWLALALWFISRRRETAYTTLD